MCPHLALKPKDNLVFSSNILKLLLVIVQLSREP